MVLWQNAAIVFISFGRKWASQIISYKALQRTKIDYIKYLYLLFGQKDVLKKLIGVLPEREDCPDFRLSLDWGVVSYHHLHLAQGLLMVPLTLEQQLPWNHQGLWPVE